MAAAAVDGGCNTTRRTLSGSESWRNAKSTALLKCNGVSSRIQAGRKRRDWNSADEMTEEIAVLHRQRMIRAGSD